MSENAVPCLGGRPAGSTTSGLAQAHDLAVAGAVLFFRVVPGTALLPSWLPVVPAHVNLYDGLALGALLLFVSVLCARVVAAELLRMWARAPRGS